LLKARLANTALNAVVIALDNFLLDERVKRSSNESASYCGEANCASNP